MSLYKAIRSQPLFVIKRQIVNNTLYVDLSNCSALSYAISLGKKDVAMYLLDMQISVNKQYSEPSNTPLHHAINLGDMELIEKLLDKNASVVTVDAACNTPLHLAFILGHNKLKDLLLDAIVKTSSYVNVKNNVGLSHFLIACTSRNATLISKYVQNQSNLTDVIATDSPYYPGYSAIQLAIEFRSPVGIKLLLEHGVGYLENQLPAALEYAKSSHGDLAIIIDMLSVHVQRVSSNELSLFHIACLQSNPALINSFLSYGAEVNSRVSDRAVFCAGYTPLHCAVESNCEENLKLLLQYGANLTISNSCYMTPLHLALYNDNKDILNLVYEWTPNKVIECIDFNNLNYFHIAVAMNDMVVVKKFLDHNKCNMNAKVDYNLRNFSGFTALHFAVRYGHTKMAKLLVMNGADIQVSDKGAYGTPLHMAVSAGNCRLIKLFLDNKARTNVLRPYDCKNMLHLLVDSFMDAGGRTIKLLDYIPVFVIQYDLNINAKDSDGYTPLHYACRKISIGASCAKILLDYGADINIENNVHDTPFQITFYDLYRNNADDYMILFNHVKGLLKLQLSVNQKNEQCCMKLLKEHDKLQKGAECLRISSLNKKQQERTNEMLRMIHLQLTPNMSLCDFLLKKKEELHRLCNNALLNRILDTFLLQDFPNFGYLVKLQCYQLQKLTKNA